MLCYFWAMANKRIESLHVDGVGPFSDFNVKFEPKQNPDEAEVHIFTGENGVGKSTLLYCLTVIANEQGFIIPRTSSRGNIVIEAESGNGVRSSQFTFDNIENDSVSITDPNFIFNSHFYNSKATFLDNYLFDFAMFAYSSYRRLDSSNINGIEEINGNPLYGALSFSTNYNPKNLLDWIANNKTKEALASVENAKADSVKFANNIDKITTAICEITGLYIQFHLVYKPILKVVMTIEANVIEFDILPDGLKSIISWIADLLMRMDRIPWVDNQDVFDRNFILFLDEIEVHLHPAWQRKILPVVKKLFKNAQIFISTHSPFVIGSVDGAWIHKLKREGQKSVLDGPAILSEDAKSYRLILQEIFGIEDDFGPDVMKDLDIFYNWKNEILKGDKQLDDAEFLSFADSLAVQSMELQTIIGMELRQLNRIKGQQAV